MFRCSVLDFNYTCFSFVRISSDHPLVGVIVKDMEEEVWEKEVCVTCSKQHMDKVRLTIVEITEHDFWRVWANIFLLNMLFKAPIFSVYQNM